MEVFSAVRVSASEWSLKNGGDSRMRYYDLQGQGSSASRMRTKVRLSAESSSVPALERLRQKG